MSEPTRPAAAGTASRGRFIPVRKSEIVEALVAERTLAPEADKVRQFCRLLGAIYHFENYDELETLREDYFYFNPELGTQDRLPAVEREAKRRELMAVLADVLQKADYKEIAHDEVENAHNQRHLLRVKVRAPLDDYHQVQFFERGRHIERIDVRRWLGLRRNEVDATVFENVVLAVSVKAREEIQSKRQLARLEASGFKPGTILIKYFRNITASDLYMLLPKVRVVMSLKDQLWLGVPALVGGLPLVIKLLPAVAVLWLVAGYWLGLGYEIDNEMLVTSLGALTGIAAVIGFMLTQRMKYQKRSLEYQKEISDHFYFRNVSNNSGIFDSLVGSAEDQEFKEAALGYLFLLMATESITKAELDRRIERWLLERFGVDIDFDVGDALDKLARLGLLKREGDGFQEPALADALVRLDTIWDNYFTYAEQARAFA